MGLVLIVQHELQDGARDLVAIDDEDPLVFDGSGTFDTDLHMRLAVVGNQPERGELH
jgi:hypothetical protein